MADDLEFNVSYRLFDYLAYQGWCVRQYFWRRVAFFLLCVTLPMIAVPLVGGEPLAEVFETVFNAWRLYPLIILGFLTFYLLLPFFSTALFWFLRRVPRENRILLSSESMVFFNSDYSLGTGWSKVLSILRTKSAYIVRTKKLIMRLPQRELSDTERASFEAYVKTRVPKAAIRF
jgi:hypothetical protein